MEKDNPLLPGKRSLILLQSEVDCLVQSHVTGCHDIHMLIPQELGFLQDLVADGNWDYVVQFLSPLKDCEGHAHSLYLVQKQEYIELCTDEKERGERGRTILNKLKTLSPNQEELETLSLLLTHPSPLSSHPLYYGWSLKGSRDELFRHLVRFLSSHMILPTMPTSKLVRLVARGLMYELCENFILDTCNETGKLHVPPGGHMFDILNWLKSQPKSVITGTPPIDTIPIILSSDNESPMVPLGDKATPITTPLTTPPQVDNYDGIPWLKTESSTTQSRQTGLSSLPQAPPSTNDSPKPLPHSSTSNTRLHGNGESTDRPMLNFSLATVVREKQVVRAVAFSTNGLAAVGANTRTLRIYDTAPLLEKTSHSPSSPPSLRELYMKPDYHRGSIYSLDWRRDSSLLVSGSNDQSIHLLSYVDDQFQQVADLKDFGGTVREARFLSSLTDLVAAGNGPHPLQLVDIERFVVTQDFKISEPSILSLAPVDNNTFLSGGEKGSIILWDTRCLSSPSIIHSFLHSITSLSIHRDNIACSTSSGHCYALSLKSTSLIHQWRPHKDECRSIRYSPDGRWILSSSYDGSVVLSDASSYQCSVVDRLSNKVIQSRWDHTGDLIACTSADKTVSFWKRNNVTA